MVFSASRAAAALLVLAAGPAFAQSGGAVCDTGQWVMVPGQAYPGTVTGSSDGNCVIQMQTGETVTHAPGELSAVNAPGSGAPSAGSAANLAAPTPGAYTCRSATKPDVSVTLSVTAEGGYSLGGAVQGSGTWGAVDGQSIEFDAGPYLGVVATVNGTGIAFSAPDLGSLACAPN